MDNYIIYFLLLVQVILLILILIKLKTNQNDEFVVSNGILLALINFYNDMILQTKLEALRPQFDLDPSSKTQAIKAFNEVYNNLLSDSAKEIMKKYLSKHCLEILLKQYSVDGLALMIISNLKR